MMPTVAVEDATTRIDQLLRQLDRLHTSPAVALRVLQLTRDEDFDYDDVQNCLETDPALTAAVLRLVNSSFYGLSRKVTAVREAMAYLGRRSLRLTVLGFGLTKSLASGCPKAFHDIYWKRSLSMAVASGLLAQRCERRELHPDTAFTTGLLADLGMAVLAQLKTDAYLKLCENTDHLVTQLREEERQLGFTHVDVGVRLLGNWHLSQEMIQAVAEHHQLPSDAGRLSQVVKTASVLSEVLWTANSPHMRILLPLLKTRFDLDVDDLIDLATGCKQAVQENMEVFQVRITGEIDVDALQREARALYEAAVLETAMDLDFLEQVS
jgi:HD-like signal output (HDOD) protein